MDGAYTMRKAHVNALFTQVSKHLVDVVTLLSFLCYPTSNFIWILPLLSRASILLSCGTRCVSEAIWNLQEEIQQGGLQVFLAVSY